MSRSKLLSVAVATGLAVSGAQAAPNPGTGDQTGDMIDAVALDLGPAGGMSAAEFAGTDVIVTAPGSDADDLLLYGGPGAEQDAIGDMMIPIEPSEFDFMQGGQTGEDDLLLAQTLYGGGGGTDGIAAPRATPNINGQQPKLQKPGAGKLKVDRKRLKKPGKLKQQ